MRNIQYDKPEASTAVVSSESAGHLVGAIFESPKLQALFRQVNALEGRAEEKKGEEREYKEAHIKEKQAEGVPTDQPLTDIEQEVLLPVSTFSNAGFVGINIIENRHSISYVLNEFGGAAGKKWSNFMDSIPTKDWVAIHGLASMATSYGINPDNYKQEAIKNTGAFFAREAVKYVFNSKHDYQHTSKGGIYNFISENTGNMILSAATTIVSTAAIAAVTGSTLGVGGIMLPIVASLGNDLIKYSYIKSDASCDSVASNVIPVLTGFASAIYTIYSAPTLTDVNAITSSFSNIQKFFTGVSSFASTYLITKNAMSYLPEMFSPNKVSLSNNFATKMVAPQTEKISFYEWVSNTCHASEDTCLIGESI
jgi:hypothetical protein